MENELTGRIIKAGKGSEASLIIPIKNYRIMILSDDSCGVGNGEILRAELFVYHKDRNPSENINIELFASNLVIANSETILKAIAYCNK